MQTPNLNNTFIGGMYNDVLPRFSPPNTYRWAWNAVNKTGEYKNFGLANERKAKEIEQFEDVKGAVYVEILNSTLVFDAASGLSLYLIDHKNNFKKTFVCSSEEFGCDWGGSSCEWINPTIKIMQPCDEPIVYFSSGCEYYKVNLAEMLDEKRKAKLKELISNSDTSEQVCGYDCSYFKLMNCTCAPSNFISKRKGGGELESGIYQFAVQLEDNSGNTTNWSMISDKISIGSENNLAGEFSSHTIDVGIYDLDCGYDKVHIAVIKNQADTAEIVATRNYTNNSISFQYTGQRGRVIPIEEILIKKRQYIRGQELTQKDGRLWLYKIQAENNLDMQRRVQSSTKLTFQEYISDARTSEDIEMMSFERGEFYLFGVQYHFCDGTSTPAFLMNPMLNGRSTGAVVSGFTGEDTGSGGAGDTSNIGSSNVPEPTAEHTGKYIRKQKQSGLIGPCLEGEGDCNQSPETPQVDDIYPETPLDVTDNIDSWVTEKANVVEALKCDGCVPLEDQIDPRGCCVDDGSGGTIWVPYEDPNPVADNCIGCDEDEVAFETDFPKAEDITVKHMDQLSDMLENGGTKDTVTYTSTSLKTAAKRLSEAVDNKEYHEQVARKSNIDNTTTGAGNVSTGQSLGSGDIPTLDSNDKIMKDGDPIITNNITLGKEFRPIIKRTATTKYPDSLACDGEFLYGDLANQPIGLFGAPTVEESQPFIPRSTGVPSKESPGIDPIYDNQIVTLGVRVTDVPMPDESELPKPLCSNKPWSLVMVPRDFSNSTIQAKGIVTSCMAGKVNGKDMIYQRHGLNSREKYSRYIDNGGSRVGVNAPNVYNFWSLDSAVNNIPLTGTTLRVEGIYRGHGYRHGLYSKGVDPELPLTGRRVDQRGARQSINPNLYEAASGDYTINGLTYVQANRTTYIPNTDYDFNNRHSVSTVAMALSGALPGEQEDKSFIADGYNHSCPIKSGHVWACSIIKDLPDQYGSVEGIQFIPTGVSSFRGSTSSAGIAGDVFIGPHTFVKKGYVSDKVGDTYPTPMRSRTVCDSPHSSALQDLGLDYNKTELPNDSDITDAKNWANAYQGPLGAPFTWEQAVDSSFTGVDLYYPKVVKTLIYSMGEFRVNPWMRATRKGPAKELGGVYVPKLKELELDSDVDQAAWEDSFLNRFYFKIEQPSKSQLIRKAIVKMIVEAIPALGIASIIEQFDAVGSGVAVLAVLPILIAYWYFLEQIATSDTYIDNMLGLPKCAMDSQGGESDNNITNFEDNYYDYNNDYSKQNTLNYIQSMPALYNTCICNQCDDYVTNDIFFSNPQIPGSPLDAYNNFKALNYTSIDSSKGKLQKLFNLNGDFFFHTTKGLGILQYSSISTQTTVGASLLGGNDLLFNPHLFLEGTDAGYAGVSGTNQGQVTPLGYFFVDENSKKLYRVTGRELPKEISAIGNEMFFNKALSYCDKQDCHDKKKKDGSGIAIEYDPFIDNRILITKKDGEQGNSFTVSFDPTANGGQGAFISLHEYTPEHYVRDNEHLLFFSDNKLFLHNAEDDHYEWGIEYVGTTPFQSNALQNLEIYLENSSNDLKDQDLFFDTLAIYNDSQGTGTLRTKVFSDDMGQNENRLARIEETPDIKVHKDGRSLYRINDIYDNTQKSCKGRPSTITDDCKLIPEINENNYSCENSNGQTFANRKLKSDFQVVRLTKKESEVEFKLLNSNIITNSK